MRPSEPSFLLIGVLAVTDARNLAPISNIGPLIIGLLVFAIGISFGGQQRIRDQSRP